MKGSRNENNKQSKQTVSNRPVPEIRDSLDSRMNEESDNDTKAHNKKETKAGKGKRH